MNLFFLLLAVLTAWLVYRNTRYNSNRWLWTGGAFIGAIILMPLVFDQLGIVVPSLGDIFGVTDVDLTSEQPA
jgi:4-amino-4-deoxy-L-arabinose transferase-like glycosyltransferase